MIVISDSYKYADPDMTNNFLIRTEFVKRVWDIDPGVIGISFISTYDVYKYRIELENESKKLLAKDVLKIIIERMETTIFGTVKYDKYRC